jgi:hypothetical protein
MSFWKEKVFVQDNIYFGGGLVVGVLIDKADCFAEIRRFGELLFVLDG